MSERMSPAKWEEFEDSTDRLLGRAVRGRYCVTTDEETAESMDAMNARDMRAHSHEEAVERFMEAHASNLDYPEETDVWVWQSGADDKPLKFTASAERVTIYRVIKSEGGV